MKNGDRVSGLLLKVEGDIVVWDSFNFGTLRVAKDKVLNLEVSANVKMEGRTEPCTIEGLSGPYLNYRCGVRKVLNKAEFAVVDSVIPYTEYKEGAFTYEGKTSVAVSLKRGNDVKDDIDINTAVKFRQGDWRHMMEVDFESESNNNETSNDKYEITYRLDWFFAERWFWYNETDIGADEHKNIDQSYSIGTGLGVQLWDFNHTAMSLISGFTFTQEDFDPTDEDLLNPDWESRRDETFWRLGYDLRYRLPFSVNLVSKAELLYSLKESDDWVLDADLGFNVPLGGRLVSEYKLEYDFDNKPNGDNRKEDKKLTIGIGYKW